jgi:hypothetical protein
VGPVAQVVEQLTFNQWVEGSNPSGLTTIFLKKIFITSGNLVRRHGLGFSRFFGTKRIGDAANAPGLNNFYLLLRFRATPPNVKFVLVLGE